MYYSKKPDWIKVKALSAEAENNIFTISKKYDLSTVCSESKCPNANECWSAKTATFLLLGNVCTRNCLFCSVTTGNPHTIFDSEEPYKTAMAVKELNLKYVVLTSVDRDDLPDGGADHFANTIREIKKLDSSIIVESLIPDFAGNIKSLEKIIDAGVDVIGHNIETVKRLNSKIRDKRANYNTSLDILKLSKAINSNILTKSSIQLGFGEKEYEIKETLHDLKDYNVSVITIGQYLRPGKNQIPVFEYIKPYKFKEYEEYGKNLGFTKLFAGPFVRSSYKAAKIYKDSLPKN